MNRRNFCKTITSVLIAWGLNPVLAFANNGNRILNGEFFIDTKSASDRFNDLKNNIIETKNEKNNHKSSRRFLFSKARNKTKIHL